MQDKRAEVIPWVCRPPAVVTRRDGRAAGEYGAVGGMPPCEGLSALLAEVEEAGFRRPTGLRPGALHGRPPQAITTGAEMAAAEKRRDVGRLSPMSTSVLHGRVSSGWCRYADLSKYC